MMSGQLECINLCKHFVSPRGDVIALDDISCGVRQSEFVAIVGPSGCGKSTLLRVIAGLLQADKGEIRFDGWTQPPRCRLVFQDHALFPWMTIVDNVAFGLEMDGVPLALRRQQATAQLASMGLADFASYYPHELSGGMRQRAAIARAFVSAPEILLMDEPLRALDAQMRLVVQEELLALWSRQKQLVIYVTHDIEEALLLADRVLVMSGQPGHIRAEITPPFDRPRDLTGRAHPELEELKWQIWAMLEDEVRQKLQPPTR